MHEGDSLLIKLSRVFTDDLTVTEVEPFLVLGDFFLRGGALGNDVCPLVEGTDREVECPRVEGTSCESGSLQLMLLAVGVGLHTGSCVLPSAL